MPTEKNIDALKVLKEEKEHLFETIDEILDERQMKRDEMRRRF